MIDLLYFYIRDYEYQREIPSHNHSIYEFVYYQKGDGKGIINGKEYFFSDNSIVIIPPSLFHEEKHFGSSIVFIVGFETDTILPDLTISIASSKIIKLLLKMKDEKLSKQYYYKDVLKSLFEEVIVYCIRDNLSNNTHEKLGQTYTSIQNAVNYIDQYFNTEIDLNKLASESGYCTDRFRNLFKEEIGESPKKYILSKRLSLAKKLILENNVDMEEIATLTGFKSYIRFSLFFKEQTSMSPQEYQKKYNNKTI